MRESNKYRPNLFIRLFSNTCLRFSLLVCFIVFSSFQVNVADPMQVIDADPVIELNLNPIISFDDVSVDFTVNGYLKFETDVIISESNSVYINVEGLFRDLGVKCVSDDDRNRLTGFVENESKTYSIDYKTSQITVGKKTYKAVNGIIKESGDIYVKSTVLTEAFGLNSIFNFRSLSIKMESNFELPAIKQMRLESMRKNVSKLQQNDLVVDTIIGRNYHMFQFGMVDWSLSSYQKNNKVTNNRVVIGAGAELLYGQANVSVYYDDVNKFNKRQFYYNWRWVDNEKTAIRQAEVGKIHNESISFLESSLVGAAVSNTPTTVRKASGYYTINDHTEPNWSVELYINDVLVDYTVADASGLYVFKVPIVYGYTILKLKFYGPMGEERVEERTKNVPFTFMPANTLEYRISGGVLQDDGSSTFGRGVVNYGLNSLITIGGGLEYLSSISDEPYIPFATLAFQPFNRMIMNFEYAHHVKMVGLLNYNFGKSASLEVDYTDFVDGQLATLINANEELKTRLSLPYKINKVSGYTRLDYNQFAYNEFNFNQLSAAFSGYYKNYSANLTNQINWLSEEDPYMISKLSLSYRMRNAFVWRPSVEYNVTDNQTTRCKVELEKRVSKAYFSVYYEKDMISKNNNVFFSFRYDLPFARAGVTASYNNHDFYSSESAEGSFAFGGDNHYVRAGNTPSVGKGGLLFYPFLDLNHNGVKDENEKMILMSDVRVSGGRAIISKKDSIVRISDLTPFIYYTVEFTENDLENIAWRIEHKTYKVLVDPNQYKRVFMPIISVGEVSGMVYLNKNDALKGLGRVVVQMIDKQDNVVAETLSESDGYFSYLGLKPGDYTVRVNEQQLEKLDYESIPLLHQSLIKSLIDGDVMEGLNFVLQTKGTSSSIQHKSDSIEDDKLLEISLISDTLEAEFLSDESPSSDLNSQDEEAKIVEADVKLRANINTSFTDISTTDAFFNTVQIGIYRNYVTAEQLQNLTPIFYEVLSNGTNRYFSGQYATVAEAEKARDQILAKGVKGAFVLSFENGKETVLEEVPSDKASTEATTPIPVKAEPEVVPVRANINTSFTDISTTDAFFNTVQIGIYRNYVTAEQLQNLTPIFYEVLSNGTNRYFSGQYATVAEAEKARDQILAKGVKGAFVLSFENGKESILEEVSSDKVSTEVTTSIAVKAEPEVVPVRANINTSFTDISTTDAFFNTVQIGIYRNYVTAEQLQNLTPIFYEVLSNGTNRYFSGQYATVAEAEKARDQILAKGVKGAFVLSFENGKETVLEEVPSDKASTEATTPIPVKAEPEVVPVRANINTSFTDISTTDAFFNTVQIGIYRNYVTAEQLQNLDPIYYEKLANGTNRYFSGNYATVAEAEKARDQILAKGVKGAYVLSFENGKETVLGGVLPKDVSVDAVIDKQRFDKEESKDTSDVNNEKGEGLDVVLPVLWKRYGYLFLILLLLLIALGVRRSFKRKS